MISVTAALVEIYVLSALVLGVKIAMLNVIKRDSDVIMIGVVKTTLIKWQFMIH